MAGGSAGSTDRTVAALSVRPALGQPVDKLTCLLLAHLLTALLSFGRRGSLANFTLCDTIEGLALIVGKVKAGAWVGPRFRLHTEGSHRLIDIRVLWSLLVLPPFRSLHRGKFEFLELRDPNPLEITQAAMLIGTHALKFLRRVEPCDEFVTLVLVLLL